MALRIGEQGYKAGHSLHSSIEVEISTAETARDAEKSTENFSELCVLSGEHGQAPCSAQVVKEF